MPVIICTNHGRQFATEVCPHIAERYLHKARPGAIKLVCGIFLEPNTMLFWSCSECSAVYGFGEENCQIDFCDIPDEFMGKLYPICRLCLEAWRTDDPGKVERRFSIHGSRKVKRGCRLRIGDLDKQMSDDRAS